MVELRGEAVEVVLRHVDRDVDEFLMYEAALEHDEQQHLALAHAHEVHVMEAHGVERSYRGDADVVRDAAEHLGGRGEHLLEPLLVLHHFFEELHGGAGVVDAPEHGVDVEAVALRRRNPAGRGVSLLEEAEVFEVGHLVAYRRGAAPREVAARDRARADRLAVLYIFVDDGEHYLELSFRDHPGFTAFRPLSLLALIHHEC